jgi:hypothetical protein
MMAILSSLLHSTCTSESAPADAPKPCAPGCWLNRSARARLARSAACWGSCQACGLMLLRGLPAAVTLRLLLLLKGAPAAVAA